MSAPTEPDQVKALNDAALAYGRAKRKLEAQDHPKGQFERLVKAYDVAAKRLLAAAYAHALPVILTEE